MTDFYLPDVPAPNLNSQVQPKTIEVIVDGQRYRMPLVEISPGVEVTKTGSYPQRVVIGADDAFKHNWLSGVAQNSWAGGGQIHEAQPATDIDRYDGIGKMDTRWPQELINMPETLEFGAASAALSGVCWMLGDLKVSGAWRCYGTVDEDIVRVENDGISDTGHNLAFSPVNDSVLFSGSGGTLRLWVPYGSHGYGTYDGAAVVNKTDIQFISFEVFAGQLWGLDTIGQLWMNSLGGTTLATDWGGAPVAKVDLSYEPQHLRCYHDAGSAPTLLIICSNIALLYDSGSKMFYELSVKYPRSSRAGKDSAVWRTDLYVTYGVEFATYTGGTVVYKGLGRDDGVDPTEATKIASVKDAWNELLFLMECDPTPIVGGGGSQAQGVTQEGVMGVASAGFKAKVLRHDGYGGFHPAWWSPRNGTGTTNMFITNIGDAFAAVWGFDGSFWYQELPMNFQAPRYNPTKRVVQEGELTGAWVSPSGEMTLNILSSMQVKAEKWENKTSWASFELQLDNEESTWFEVMRIGGAAVRNRDGIYYEARLGRQEYVLPDLTPAYTGLRCNRYRYRIRTNLAPSDRFGNIPFIQSLAVTFMPVMGDEDVLVFRVDCSSPNFDDNAWGLTNEQRQRLLDDLREGDFVALSIDGYWQMVKIISVTAYQIPGQSRIGDRSITAVCTFQP